MSGSLSLERFAALKRKVEEDSREIERAKGAYAQLMKELKSQHGCGTLKEAEAKLAKMTKALAAKEEAFEAKLEAFECEYGDE